METKTKSLRYFIMIVIVAVLFAAGWLAVKTSVLDLGHLPFTGGTPTPAISALKNDPAAYQQATYENLSAIFKPEEKELPLLLNCSGDACSLKNNQSPPYQWLRYAEFANAYLNNNTDSFPQYLNDLFTYQPKDFDWKLFQYGDMIDMANIQDKKFQDKYLEILNIIDHPSYFTQPITQFQFYTDENPIPENALMGTAVGKNGDYSVGIMDYSTEAIELGYAFKFTKDEKYLSGMNKILTMTHMFLYAENPAELKSDEYFKISTCYAALADAKAYEITRNEQYLGYIDYLISNGSFNNIFTRTYSENSSKTNNPMFVLPCLDAFENLTNEFPADKTYADHYVLIYNYLVNGLFQKTSNSEYGGFLSLDGSQLDVNSTAWFNKIIAIKLVHDKNNSK